MKLLDNIYVITIERNKERQVRIADLLKKFGLKFKFIKGVDGNEITDDNLKSIFNDKKSEQRLGYLLTKNEIACSLSHIKALNMFLENDEQKFALILEDDIEIINFEKLDNAIRSLSKTKKWDLLYLGYQQMNLKMPRNIYLKFLFIYPILNFLNLKKYNLKKLRRTFARPYNKHWITAGSHNNSHAYLVTKSGAKKIVNSNTPVYAQSDVILMDLITNGSIEALALKNPVFEQSSDLKSSIGSRNSW